MEQTFGVDFNEALDGNRIRKQHEVIRDIMLDGKWRTLYFISQITGYPESSVSAQLRHLRKDKFGSYIVNKRRASISKPGTWEYQVINPKPNEQILLF